MSLSDSDDDDEEEEAKEQTPEEKLLSAFLAKFALELTSEVGKVSEKYEG